MMFSPGDTMAGILGDNHRRLDGLWRSTDCDEGRGNTQSSGTRDGGRFTEPQPPPKRVVQENGVEIVHFTRSGEHGPAHLHVRGGGPDTKIGQAGRPILGSPELTTA